MISLLLSSLLLLLAFIIVNSTPQISRQTPFFDPFRKEKQGPSEIKCFDRFLQARAPHILTPKEHVFDMPISTNYSPTGRPPGEFHLRHSFKEITDILEFPSPPFNIFFTEMNANNYNYYYYYHIICYNNGDAVEDEDGSEDGPYVTSSYCIITNVELEILDNWTLNQADLVHLRDLYEYNNSTNQIETIVDTSPVTLGMSVVASTATCTTISTNKDSGNNDGNVSNSDNSNNNNDSNSTSTTVTSTATTSTTTTTTTTIDYNTSTNDKDNGIISTIHRTDTISIDSISSNSNNNNSSNNNINPCTEFAMGQSIELIHNNNNKSSSTYMTDAYPISTTTITYNTSTYDDNNNAYIAHSIHRTDTIQWFESILNNNNNKSISIFTTDTSPSADMTDATSTATTTTTTTIIPSINYITITDDKDNRIILTIHRTDTLSIDLISSNNNNNNKNSNIIRSSSAYMTSDPSTTTSTTINNKNDKNKTFHLSFIFKLISLYLIITKSLSSKEFKIALKEKHHHQQQQQHYHGTHRHQSHLEQQRNHQHFKQQHHNMERMVTSIVLKLSLVAWDMWAFRNVF
jgi:hypothetical protein